MCRYTSIFKCLLLLCTLFLISQRVEGTTFHPRNVGSMPARRQDAQCEPATPGVSQDALIWDACNQNPQNNENNCFNELVVYIKDSATNVCAHFYALYNDCLVLNSYDETACPDEKTGYLDCSNYTLQAYAYCGCYYSRPADIYTCANVELQVRPSAVIATSNIPTATTLPILTGPVTTSGQSLLTSFLGPSFASSDSTSTGPDTTTMAVTGEPSSDAPSLTIISTPTVSSLPEISDIIASPTVVRSLTSTTEATDSMTSTAEVSSATNDVGATRRRVAVQTTSVGVCITKKRTRILKAV